MRIVAGAARGHRLAVPEKGTRPTSDRAREALFNTLTALVDFDDAHVLDLFAGSGAVGLEALSRGASRATFVESDRRAVDVLRRNIESVGLPGATIARLPVASYLKSTPAGDLRFAFADPPYALPDDELRALLTRLGEGWLESDAIVVVERSSRGSDLCWPDTFESLKQRRYGEGMLWYGRHR